MKLIALLAFLFFASSAFAKELTTVDHVDLTRYQGAWYEIGSIPNSFQNKCVGSTTAQYELLPDGEVRVYNSCKLEDGSFTLAEGRAKSVDPKTNAKLKVTFVKIGDRYIYLFGGKYWIIKLDPNYEYVVVGHPSRNYGWILSRSSSMPLEKLRELALFIKAQDYDICRFYTTPQPGGYKTKKSFCAGK